MKTTLGLSVDPGTLRAVVVRHGSVAWAATASFDTVGDLGQAVSDLARDRPAGVRTIQIGLSGSVGQLRLVWGLPRLSRAELVRHVRLVPRRFFLQNGARLICDAEPASILPWRRAECSILVAAPEPMMEALVAGAAAAGLDVTAASHASVWLARGHARALDLSASPGIEFLLACAAASSSAPSLSLLPATIVATRRRALRRSLHRWTLAATGSAMLAIGSYLGALVLQGHETARELANLETSVARVRAIRRDLDQANAALAFLHQGAGRPTQRAGLLGSLTRALPAGAFLSSFRVDGGGRVTLSVFAPRAAALLSGLDKAGLGRAILEGSITREIVGGREYDRFSAVLVPYGSRAR